VLDLAGATTHRCAEEKMSQRTWVCVNCGKSYRRDQLVESVTCALCQEACEYVHWKIHIPSPSKPKAWKEFWEKYRAEKLVLDRYQRGEQSEEVHLEILNMHLIPRKR
jgi:hypothetical protein